jgi:CHASE2 domain-containing sensor protein
MKQLLRRKLTWAILVIAAISIVSALLDLAGLFEVPELKTVDLRTRLYRTKESAPSDIALILIDESSLNALNGIAGRWP